MKIERIVLNNFRPFYGKNVLNFLIDSSSKKLTVIHAENQSGKTNFVDAFRWAFYAKIQGEQPEQIVNHRALAEASDGDVVTASVEISFQHNLKKYEIIRKITEKKISKDHSARIGETELRLYEIKLDGRREEHYDSALRIEKILPIGMDQYFFLAGENIQSLGQEESKEKIKEAIKILMGLEILDRAKRHLTVNVRNHLREELKKVAPVNDQEIIKKLDDTENNKQNVLEQLKICKDNKTALVTEQERIEAKLRQGTNTRELQRQKDELVAELDDVQKHLNSTNTSIMERLTKEGYLAFMKKCFLEVENIIESKREKGVLPVDISYAFISDIMERGYCICHRELVQGTDPYKKVLKLRDPEKKAEYVDAYNTIGSVMSGLLRIHERLPQDLEKDFQYRQSCYMALADLKQQLAAIEAQYDDKVFESERGLIERKRKIEEQKGEISEEIGKLKAHLQGLESKIVDFRKELENSQALNSKHALAQKRLSLCEKAAQFIDELHQTLIQRDRKVLCDRMNKIFKEIMAGREDAEINLNADFELTVRVKMSDGGIKILPKGGAQMQITCLSFIASVVAIAKENMEKEGVFERGGIYPLVLDSPFGVMAHDYRKRVSRKLVEFAEQIIILVAPQQWDKYIEQELEPYISKRYIFQRFTAQPSTEIVQKIKGKEYILSQYCDGNVQTIIQEGEV